MTRTYAAAATVLTLVLLQAFRTTAQQRHWWNPASGEPIAATATYANPSGSLEILNTGGVVQTKGHPFCFLPRSMDPIARACRRPRRRRTRCC